jgi:hypothetical protein
MSLHQNQRRRNELLMVLRKSAEKVYRRSFLQPPELETMAKQVNQTSGMVLAELAAMAPKQKEQTA